MEEINVSVYSDDAPTPRAGMETGRGIALIWSVTC